MTQAEGYWIVEAMEPFEDTLDGETVNVQVGEKRIVPPRTVHKHKALPPIVQEHTYERKLEKKLKSMVDEEGKNQPPEKQAR